MNSLNGSGAGADQVIPANDVLRARPAAVLARGDAAREDRLGEVDLVVVPAVIQQLEARLLDGSGRIHPPAHDGYVLLSAVNQLDVLRGERRRDEVQLATPGGCLLYTSDAADERS